MTASNDDVYSDIFNAVVFEGDETKAIFLFSEATEDGRAGFLRDPENLESLLFHAEGAGYGVLYNLLATAGKNDSSCFEGVTDIRSWKSRIGGDR